MPIGASPLRKEEALLLQVNQDVLKVGPVPPRPHAFMEALLSMPTQELIDETQRELRELQGNALLGSGPGLHKAMHCWGQVQGSEPPQGNGWV